MDKIVTCGPFVGSFFEEIINFRPFVQWIEENLIYDDLFIFSHFNRSFLYNKNVIPIFEQYSFDIEKQKLHLNLDISPSLYNVIFKSLKNDVIRITGCQPTEIISLFNKYPKNKIKIPWLNKTWNEIKFEKCLTNDIVFIPYKTQSKKKLKAILSELQQNIIIISDGNTYFSDDNYINKSEMLLDMYGHIVKIISNAKAVICPLSNWTFLCNLQKTPVFSWGNGNLSPYKIGGLYNFGNEKSYIIADTNVKNIVTSINRFLDNLKEK